MLTLTVILFASDRLRLDMVALLALLALLLSGILTPAEALAGFSDPIVLIIAALFIVGAGLFQTGVADALGQQLMRFAGAGEARLIAAIMLIVALLSAFLSSTGTVAVFCRWRSVWHDAPASARRNCCCRWLTVRSSAAC